MSTWIAGKGTIPAVTTNADRIRAMTDEELAMALPFPQCPPHEGKCTFSTMIANSCDQCWFNWLRQEVKEN